MPTETLWGQQPLEYATLTNAKNAGLMGIRIPVTWADHFISDAPEYTVDPVWLQRISDVADYAIDNGRYAIVNNHQDSWSWLNPDADGFNKNEAIAKFYRLWFQIGTTLGCKSEHLVFETINEPSRDTSSAEDAAFLNSLHADIVKATSDARGFNKDRVVILCGLSDGYTTATQYLELPQNIEIP